MLLSIQDIANALKLPVSTIERWANQGNIPANVKKNAYFFDEIIIKKWAKEHQLSFCLHKKTETEELNEEPPSLFRSMKAGSVVYGLSGQSVNELLSKACQSVPLAINNKKKLLEMLIEREKLTSTGVGKGVAIPHPRTPMPDIPSPIITTCFLKKPIDFKAIDNQNVFVLFILLCPKVNVHLQLLSRLAYCIRENEFVSFLRTKPSEMSLLSEVKKIEKKLEKTNL